MLLQNTCFSRIDSNYLLHFDMLFILIYFEFDEIWLTEFIKEISGYKIKNADSTEGEINKLRFFLISNLDRNDKYDVVMFKQLLI